MENKLSHILRVCVIIALSAPLPSVYALQSDASQPVQISAENGEASQQDQSTTLSNNVHITRGSINIYADRGHVALDKNGDKYITLWGSPIRFSQQQDDGSVVSGQCNQFDYNTKTNLAILTGRARLKRGKDQINGEIISYNTQSQVYSARGVAANGVNKTHRASRITIILNDLDKQHAPTK